MINCMDELCIFMQIVMKMALMDACISPADNNYEEVDDQYDEYALILIAWKKSFKSIQTVMKITNIVKRLNRLVDKYTSDTNYIR